MAGDPQDDKQLKTTNGLVTAGQAGFNFVGTVLACILLGWIADKKFGTAPWGLLAMTLVGFVGGFWHLWNAMKGK